MSRSILYCALIFFILFETTSCGTNIYGGQANKTSEQALVEDANESLNALNFDQAISDILALQGKNALYKTDSTTLMLLASAYAGKCGFNFINYLENVVNANPGTTPLLQWLMNQWTKTKTDRTYCRKAEDTVKLITPTFLGRDPNQSMFMVLLGLAKIGIFERELYDPGATGAATPQNTAGSQPFCGTNSFAAGGATVNTDDDIADIGVGLAMVVANLGNVGTSLSGSSSLTNLTSFCNGLGAPATNPCYLEDEASFKSKAAYLKAIRTMLDTNTSPAIGLYTGLPCP